MLSRTCLIALLLAASASISALATTYVVNPNGTGDFPTIQAAIDAAIDGDIIELTDGTFTGDGNRDIDWGHNTITVRSQNGDPWACVIDCQGSAAEPHRGFVCSEEEAYNSLLQGISIINGYADRGGAILFWEAIQVENCVFSNNTATDGGAFAVVLGVQDVSVTKCVVLNNVATEDGGGMHCQEGGCNLVMCTFAWNSAGGCGGAVWAGSSNSVLRSTNCTFVFNSASNGGGICCDEMSNVIVSSIIAFSTLGEAIFCSYPCDLTLTCCDIYGNAGGDWVGCIEDQGEVNDNISEDPLFCDPDEYDFTIHSDSPCAPFSPPNEECDLIGAHPVGCPPTAAEHTTWGRIKTFYRE
jgi:predicted outer membrane repeat protein